jgi:hypothetical protein
MCFKDNTILNLFALLVFIECPQFIFSFLKILQGSSPPVSLQSLSPEFLKRNVWPEFTQQYPGDAEHLAQAFCSAKYKFSVAPLNNEYEVFNHNVILPYTNEKPLDGGASGKVYSFEILEGYRHLLVMF